MMIIKILFFLFLILVPKSLEASLINLALKPIATAATNGSSIDHPPNLTIDGNLESYWHAGTHGTPSNPSWIVVDLKGVFKIDHVLLVGTNNYNNPGYYIIYNFYISLDGANWIKKVDQGVLVDSSTLRFNTVNLNLSSARYFRFEVIGGTHDAHLNEIEIWGDSDYENLSLTNTARANASENTLNYPPELTIDGNHQTYWHSGRHGTISSPVWLIIDLGRLCKIDHLLLAGTNNYNNPGYYIKYDLFISVNKIDWIKKIDQGTLIDDPILRFNTVNLNLEKVQYIKFEVIGGTHDAHLNEMEVWGLTEPVSVYLPVMFKN